MQRARTHTRFFRLVYDSPKQSDIFSGINIRIHIVPAISALERLVFSCAKMVALRTSLRSICWLNDNQRNTCHLCLILKKCSQLIKAPRVKFLLKGLVPALGSGTYLRQILNGNAYPSELGIRYDLCGNGMVDYRCSGSLSPFKPFQKSGTSTLTFVNATFCTFVISKRKS